MRYSSQRYLFTSTSAQDLYYSSEISSGTTWAEKKVSILLS